MPSTIFFRDGFFYDDPHADVVRESSLREHVRQRLETADPQRTRATSLAARLRNYMWLDIINDWERAFLASTEHYKELSERQEAVLWRIRAKLMQWSTRS